MSEAEISAIKEELEHLKKVNSLMQEQQGKLIDKVLASDAVENVHFAALLALVTSHPDPETALNCFNRCPSLPKGQSTAYNKALDSHMEAFVNAFESAARAGRRS